MKLNSIYVSAQNFDQGKEWYSSNLFEREPDSQTDRFAFWKIGDVHFGLFNPQAIDADVKFGTNCIPNFEVESADKLHDKLKSKGAKIVMNLNDVNGTRIFQCLDSESNVLEFYHWIDKE